MEFEGREYGWVQAPDRACAAAGCQCEHYRNLTATIQEALRHMNEQIGDLALWCGIGGHAFGPRDPGRQRVTVEQWDTESEQMAPVTVMACGDHARPVQVTTRPKALANGNGSVTDPAEAARRGYDPDYVAWLEERTRAAVSTDG